MVAIYQRGEQTWVRFNDTATVYLPHPFAASIVQVAGGV